jgi:hypothetical protein
VSRHSRSVRLKLSRTTFSDSRYSHVQQPNPTRRSSVPGVKFSQQLLRPAQAAATCTSCKKCLSLSISHLRAVLSKVISLRLTEQFCIDRNGDEGWTSCDEAADFLRKVEPPNRRNGPLTHDFLGYIMTADSLLRRAVPTEGRKCTTPRGDPFRVRGQPTNPGNCTAIVAKEFAFRLNKENLLGSFQTILRFVPLPAAVNAE